MKTYDPARVLISFHTAKTAGTSFGVVLREWFGPRFYGHYVEAPRTTPERHAVGAGACVHGHFNDQRGFGLSDYYPEADQFVSFFREPFARCVSTWRYLKQGRRNGPSIWMQDDPDFPTWLHRQIDDRQRLGVRPFDRSPRFLDTKSQIATMEQQFVAVGISEEYARSVELIAGALGKPHAAIQVLNVTSGNAGDFSEYKPLVEREFGPEYEVYEAARRIYRRMEQDARHRA